MESTDHLTSFPSTTSKPISICVLISSYKICSHQTIKKDEFYALLSVADLGVITPLRDGMNTTSMEFVIAQEKSGKSPLVLSEFMGISSNMGEALQINPWNLGVSTSSLLCFLQFSNSLHRKWQQLCIVV
jgi:trehalose-6-phosphate synthase